MRRKEVAALAVFDVDQERGTVLICPGILTGRIVSNDCRPLALSACAASSSIPSPFGVVRAR